MYLLPPLSILLALSFSHGAQADQTYAILVDIPSRKVTPNALYNVPQNSTIVISNATPSESLSISESSSLATPCIQTSPDKRLVKEYFTTYQGCAGLRTRIQFNYTTTEPLIMYTVNHCNGERPLVFSINLSENDVPTLSANAKSSTKEQTPDLSYLPPLTIKPCDGIQDPNSNAPKPSLGSRGLSSGSLIGIVVGTFTGLLL